MFVCGWKVSGHSRSLAKSIISNKITITEKKYRTEIVKTTLKDQSGTDRLDV